LNPSRRACMSMRMRNEFSLSGRLTSSIRVVAEGWDRWSLNGFFVFHKTIAGERPGGTLVHAKPLLNLILCRLPFNFTAMLTTSSSKRQPLPHRSGRGTLDWFPSDICRSFARSTMTCKVLNLVTLLRTATAGIYNSSEDDERWRSKSAVLPGNVR